MAMLWLLKAFCDGPVVAAHVDHGIRGAESDGDALFVRRVAEGWGIPFMERKVSVPGGRRKGESLESAARRMRYAALRDMAAERRAEGIALGHNRDDLAETVLLNLLRGAGVRGCAGIPERRGILFRPVMGLGRNFLREILACRDIPWREDGSNQDRGCLRNFLRLDLLPLIEARVNAGASEHLVALAGEMCGRREDDERRAAALLSAALLGDEVGALLLDRKRLEGLSSFERTLLIREAGRSLGLPVLPRGRSMELARLMKGKKSFIFQWCARAQVLGERTMLRWEVAAGSEPNEEAEKSGERGEQI